MFLCARPHQLDVKCYFIHITASFDERESAGYSSRDVKVDNNFFFFK